MTCEEAIEFYSKFHERVKETGGEDWFMNVGVYPNVRCEVEETLKEIKGGDNPKLINLYRYHFRPTYCSSVGPINPTNGSGVSW